MKKFISILLSLVLCLGMCPPMASASDAVPYLDAHWDEDKGVVTYPPGTQDVYIMVSNADDTWTNGWYVVSGNITIGKRVTVTGDVHLILTDGCKLTVENGIQVQKENSLTIYGQENGTGELDANAKGTNNAGIGSDNNKVDGGTITINGGKVTATGDDNSWEDGGAGIGGGSGGAGGNITINGGTVTATGKMKSAGIGGGTDKAGGDITIRGGKVIATGSNSGAGIGGGFGGAGGTITISGGEVTAAGGNNGAAIGGGSGGAGGTIAISGGTVTATGTFNGAGIGGGSNGEGGTITISGGTVEATGKGESAAIGGGRGGEGGNITISNGTVTAQYDYNTSYKGAGIGGGNKGAGGTITINGGTVTATGSSSGAGIGGGEGGEGGTITISGGTVTATGKDKGAGIGGGSGKAGGTITISGGKVTAQGGNSGYPGGAGIGGGYNGDGGEITISGGEVTAKDSYYGAGIGGGNGGAGGTITISSGKVTATGGQWGAGVGGGYKGAGGDITISGGTVTATGRSNGGAGIGGGSSGGSCTFATSKEGEAPGSAFIEASSISHNSDPNDWSGIIFEGDNGKVYGDPTIQTNIEIPSGKTLTIPEGSTLTIPEGVTLTNNGTLKNDGTITGNGNITNDGTVNNNGTIDCSGTFTGNGHLEGEKLTPTVTKPSDLTATYGQTLAKVTLPNGWVWDDDLNTPVGNVGDNNFSATFTPNDTINYKTIKQDLTVTVGKATPATTTLTGLTATYGQTLADVNLPDGWAWDDDPKTPVGNVGPQNFSATFTPNDTINYNTVTQNLTVTVGKAKPATTPPTGLTATYGQTLAIVALTDGWKWDNSDAPVGNVGNNKFSAKFTPEDTDNYETVTQNLTVTVSPAIPTITWGADAQTQALTYTGQPAAITGPEVTLVNDEYFDGTINYSYTGTYSGNGLPANVGTYTITASIAAKGNYTAAESTDTLALTISKSTPTVTFASGYTLDKTYDGDEIPTPAAKDAVTVTGADYNDVTFEWSGTPLNAGAYTLTAKIASTPNTEAAQAILDVTISRKSITPTVTITPGSYEYTGSAIQPSGSAVKVMDGADEVPASEYTLDYDENIHAGAGSVTVTDSGSGNYTFNPVTENFTITKKRQAPLNITGKPDSIVYGDTFTLTATGGSGDGAVTWAVTDGGNYAEVNSTGGGVTAKGVGSVTITAAKAGGTDYEDATATVTFTTGKKPATATVTAADKPYDGTATAAVTASVNSSDLVSGDSITISGLAGTFSDANVGAGKTVTVDSSKATVTGTNAENYIVTYPNATASITKADAVITTVPSAQTLTYTGAAQALVTAGSANFGSVVYSLTGAGTYSTTIPTGTDAGNYIVWYKVEGTDNYNGTEPAKVDVKIEKADYSGAMTASTSAKFGATKTYDLSALLPDGATAGTAAASDVIFDGDPTVSGKTLTYKLVDDSTKVGSTGAIAVLVTSTNYRDFNLTITVTVENTDAPTLTVDPITVTYTGSAVPKDLITGTAKVEETVIAGTWKFDDGQDLINVSDSGPKNVTFTPFDAENYSEAHGTVTLKIEPAPITDAVITLSETAYKGDGTAHSPRITSVKLGNTTLNASVDYTANIPSGTDAGTYTVTVTGRRNYSGTATVTFRINPVKTEEIEQKDDNGRDLRLEVETGLSTVPPAFKDDERFNTTEKIETALRAKVAEIMTNVGEQIFVLDVRLQYKDENGVWREVDPENFPENGVTAVLPYPSGTGSTGFTFTVQHLVSSGSNAGTMETLPCELTADGLKCKFMSLSPVAVGWMKDSTKPWENPFTDVSDTGWYINAVEFVCRRGLMVGYGNGKFGTDNALTRAEFAQIIFNKEGAPSSAVGKFTDVQDGKWYANAVNWAAAQGIAAGVGGGRFAPNTPITREQLVTMLWQYAGSPEPGKDELKFADAGKVSGYAWKAMLWANETGIISGKGKDILDPKGKATRAEAAVMLMQYLENAE